MGARKAITGKHKFARPANDGNANGACRYLKPNHFIESKRSYESENRSLSR
jgi:hypothetical protein